MSEKERKGLTGATVMRYFHFTVMVILLFGLGPAFAAGFASTPHSEIPVKGMVTMVAVGSDHCLPCRTVAPILKKLKEEYSGRAAIICIDSGKDPKLTSELHVRVTPTLILFDKSGKERKRHEGLLDRRGIVSMLNEAGVQ